MLDSSWYFSSCDTTNTNTPHLSNITTLSLYSIYMPSFHLQFHHTPIQTTISFLLLTHSILSFIFPISQFLLMPTFSSNLSLVVFSFFLAIAAADFNRDAQITWGDGRAQIVEAGRGLTLSLDQFSGSGFQSKNHYLFGRFDTQLKLVPGNSAGTVTTFFLTSEGQSHDEIDFEFLGNSSGEPYTVHTNVYAQGKGNKEQQFRLWFDPSAAFHTYSIVWNAERIIFLVDNIPIRVHTNHEALGIPFPKNQPMRVQCSLWNADDWATQGGRVKADWSKAPFTAYYRNFKIEGNCAIGSCDSPNSFGDGAWQTQGLDGNGRNRLRWVQQKYMIYNYCKDAQRFPQGIPAECKQSRF